MVLYSRMLVARVELAVANFVKSVLASKLTHPDPHIQAMHMQTTNPGCW